MLQIRLLGAFEVYAAGAPVTVAGARARSLLAILALQPGRPVPVETLLERCWGSDLPADPRATLYVAVRRLRRRLGVPAIRTAGAGYVLAVPPEQVDAVAFQQTLTGAADRAGLDAALALWRGTPFDGDFCDWLQTYERPRLVELWLSAVERRADLDLAAGADVERICSELQELVGAHPLRESLWVRLLTALYASGRRAEALERHEQIRRRIAAELGVDPGPELRAVFDRLLADRPPDPPPVRPAPVPPRQLPADFPRFHGRRDLLRRLDELLAAASPGGTVLLHGLGGAGKTSLAVHWAHRVADRFPDGVLFADLHGYGPGEPADPGIVAADLLRGLGVDPNDLPTGQDARSTLLRSTLADRRVLIVLDNARSEEQVRPLLPGAGTLVLVTGRGRLRGLVVRDGAVAVPVEPLPAQEAVALLAARLPVPDDRLAELARRCGRLPLALGVAAERVLSAPGQDLDGVLAELADGSLDAFSADDPATDLRAVLSWSYAALDPPSARLFRLLGVSPAAVLTAPAAAALADLDPATAGRLLRRLVDLNLLTESAHGRFRLHDLLAAYAAERCDAEDGPPLRSVAEERLLDWYVHTARAANLALGRGTSLSDPGPPPAGVEPLAFPDPAAAQAWYNTEWRSLPDIVDLAAQRGHHARAARLAAQPWHEFYHRAALDQTFRTATTGLAAARAAGLDRWAALALNQFGTGNVSIARPAAAAEHFAAALALFTELDEPAGQTLVLSNLSMLEQGRGDAATALRHAEAAARYARLTGDDRRLARALVSVGNRHLDAGQGAAAMAVIEQAVRVWDPTPPDVYRGEILHALGQALVAQGEPHAAIPQFTAALEIYRALGVHRATVAVLAQLGAALRDTGRPAEARTAWAQAVELIDRLPGVRHDADRAEIVALLRMVSVPS